MASTQLAALFLRHHDEKKMVGKLVNLAAIGKGRPGILAFLHVHTATQHHYATNCPSPLDTVVARWLMGRDINIVFAYEQDTETLRMATVRQIMRESPLVSDGRERLYLPKGEWQERRGVVEQRVGKTRRYVGHDGRAILETPYVRREVTIE